MVEEQKFIVEEYGGVDPFSSEDVRSVVSHLAGGTYEPAGSNVFIASCSEDFIKKLAFLKRYSIYYGSYEKLEDIQSASLPDGKFYVRIIDPEGCHGSMDEARAGNLLKGQGRVSFSNPDFVVYLYHTGMWHLGIHLHHMISESSSNRRAPMRPYFTPVSMDPKYASFLVNLGYFKPGSNLLDPFCGSAGILIEAALKGYRVTGFDIVNEMVVGSRVNLKFYGIKDYDIRRQDFLSYDPDVRIDGIVTDFPYGRSSKLKYEISKLYKDSAEKMAQILDSGSRVCLVTDREDNLEYFLDHFRVDVVLKQRIHRSLTRHFVRLIKK